MEHPISVKVKQSPPRVQQAVQKAKLFRSRLRSRSRLSEDQTLRSRP